jgi:hypothetical protein
VCDQSVTVVVVGGPDMKLPCIAIAMCMAACVAPGDVSRPAGPDLVAAPPTVPIEPNAVIDDKLKSETKLMKELVTVVRTKEFRCDSISALRALQNSHGYKLVCNRSQYKYEIENKDGRWVATVE